MRLQKFKLWGTDGDNVRDGGGQVETLKVGEVAEVLRCDGIASIKVGKGSFFLPAMPGLILPGGEQKEEGIYLHTIPGIPPLPVVAVNSGYLVVAIYDKAQYPQGLCRAMQAQYGSRLLMSGASAAATEGVITLVNTVFPTRDSMWVITAFTASYDRNNAIAGAASLLRIEEETVGGAFASIWESFPPLGTNSPFHVVLKDPLFGTPGKAVRAAIPAGSAGVIGHIQLFGGMLAF